jgi:hypothetical protein
MLAQPFVLVLCPPPVFIANLQASLHVINHLKT